MSSRPNILFVMTDQHRGDCVGADPNVPKDADGRPLVHTPNIDSFVEDGALFSRAYTPSPSCIPARRSLLTGQTPSTNGAPGWVTTPWEFDRTLPSELRDAGYQTKLTGKIHSIPPRSNVGFESMDQHEALFAHENDDYTRWLESETGGADELAHGLGRNSWDPRPWHLEEYHHPTNWTTRQALEFLDQRDETRPFFLNISYVRPHTPFDPPQAYWDMYVDRDNVPEPYMGDWAEDVYGEKIPDYPAVDAWVADLSPTVIHRARAAYYGLITHIDHQLKRVFDKLMMMGELENTFVMFISDHGEMLGDHYLWRKSYGYEGSSRIPMLMQFPESMELPRKQIIDQPVGLEDVMPTLLSIAGESVPDFVEGRNLLDLVHDPDREDWREWYHGEHSPGSYDPENATQYVISDRMKYIWNQVTGEELLFDLEEDPGEETDLTGDSEYADDLERGRDAMVDRLTGREEGFVEDGELSTIAPGDEEVGDADDCSSDS